MSAEARHCEFICKRKNRKCKLYAKNESIYCTEHLYEVERNANVWDEKIFFALFLKYLLCRRL
jgi:hypothetical protein